MRAVKEIINSMENEVKSKSRRGYQALSRSFAEMRGKIGANAGRLIRKSPRSKGSGQR